MSERSRSGSLPRFRRWQASLLLRRALSSRRLRARLRGSVELLLEVEIPSKVARLDAGARRMFWQRCTGAVDRGRRFGQSGVVGSGCGVHSVQLASSSDEKEGESVRHRPAGVLSCSEARLCTRPRSGTGDHLPCLERWPMGEDNCSNTTRWAVCTVGRQAEGQSAEAVSGELGDRLSLDTSYFFTAHYSSTAPCEYPSERCCCTSGCCTTALRSEQGDLRHRDPAAPGSRIISAQASVTAFPSTTSIEHYSQVSVYSAADSQLSAAACATQPPRADSPPPFPLLPFAAFDSSPSTPTSPCSPSTQHKHGLSSLLWPALLARRYGKPAATTSSPLFHEAPAMDLIELTLPRLFFEWLAGASHRRQRISSHLG